MARGFESKDVEFQQAEAERQRTPARGSTAHDPRRVGVELSLCRVRDELAHATRPAHRQMLEHAIDDLEQQLSSLIPGAVR
jgi:hypothetical protein